MEMGVDLRKAGLTVSVVRSDFQNAECTKGVGDEYLKGGNIITRQSEDSPIKINK